MPIQMSSVYRMGWLQCWRWRKAAGPRGRVQRGFLHRLILALWVADRALDRSQP